MATSAMLHDAITFLKSAGFDLVIVETAGIDGPATGSSTWTTCPPREPAQRSNCRRVAKTVEASKLGFVEFTY